MGSVHLGEFATEIQEMWFAELVKNGRAFPDRRDGLKDSTRSALTAMAKLSSFRKGWHPATTVESEITTKYREGTPRSVHNNVMRMAGLPYPLLSSTSKDQGVLPYSNPVTGSVPAARYIQLSLTDLGVYVMKYHRYFETYQGTVSTDPKYKYIKTPLPLSLLIPQINLSDGRSNQSPSLRLYDVVEAMCLHIEKDKQTTTEELAQHINSIDTGKDSTILATSQAVYDLIERGVYKAVSLAPITFYEEEFLIKSLPYRKIGKSIIEQLKELANSQDPKKRIVTFDFLRARPEHSEEALIAIDIKIRPGYTLADVRREIYRKTYMREVIVYENFGLDMNSDKPLSISSVRSILDYHYDIGIELKRLEILDKITTLKANRRMAETREKLTRPLVAELIAATSTKTNKTQLVFTYLRNAKRMLRSKVRSILFGEQESDYYAVEYIVNQRAQAVIDKFSKRPVDIDSDLESEYLEHLMEDETPDDFEDGEIAVVFDENQKLLYNLEKRTQAIATLRSFNADLEKLEKSLDHDAIKAALIGELRDVAAPWKDHKISQTVFANKYQQKVARKDLESKVKVHVNKMNRELPVNIVVDENLVAYKTIDPVGSLYVSNPKYLFECTTYDSLVMLNNKGNSYKVPVSDIPINGISLADPKDNLRIICDHYDNQIHVVVTSFGRCLIVNSYLFAFRNKKLDHSLEPGEKIVFFSTVALGFYDKLISLIVKDAYNNIKKVQMTELKIKDNLKGFYTLFGGESSTTAVTSAALTGTTFSSIEMWANGEYRSVHYDNSRVFKRNVSKGYHLDTITGESTLIGDMLPHVNGKFITNFNLYMGRELGVSVMSDIFTPINHTASMQDIQGNISWCESSRSLRREAFEMEFEPDEHQVNYFIRANTAKQVRRVFEEEI